MKTFDDLVFYPHEITEPLLRAKDEKARLNQTIRDIGEATHATMNFPNGWEVSVVFGTFAYSNGVDTYEVGHRYCNEEGCTEWYVDGWQTKAQVTAIMVDLQQRPGYRH